MLVGGKEAGEQLALRQVKQTEAEFVPILPSTLILGPIQWDIMAEIADGR